MPLQEMSGWGRFPRRFARTQAPRTEAALRAATAAGGVVARGNGRAYGDSAIGSATTLEMRAFNRMLAFDSQSGLLVAEAGVVIADIINAFLPRGWFPSVTPGTKFVTLGGAIAADVHGKNHHGEGSFGDFVAWIDVLGADGTITRASPQSNSDLFDWTLGGMGLTGVILRAAIQLRPVESAWIRQRTQPAANLEAAFDAFEAAQDATYSAAWIDCLARGDVLGRSLLMLGEHCPVAELPQDLQAAPFAVPQRRKRRVLCDAPAFLLNRATVKAFNALYWRQGLRRAGETLVDWDSFFYPLDAVLGWNRIYGRRGFVQFQCALPTESARAGLRALLSATSAAGQGSFLAVLKQFGPGRTGRQARSGRSEGLSFPMPGYTLALDFPATARSLALLERLDAITLDHGGRFYLAKDARMAAATLHHSDARATTFQSMRRQKGLTATFGSAQSERLQL